MVLWRPILGRLVTNDGMHAVSFDVSFWMNLRETWQFGPPWWMDGFVVFFVWRVSFLLWKERFQQIVDPECNYPRLLKQPSLVTAALTAEPTDSERREPSNRQVATKCRSRDWNQILPMSHWLRQRILRIVFGMVMVVVFEKHSFFASFEAPKKTWGKWCNLTNARMFHILGCFNHHLVPGWRGRFKIIQFYLGSHWKMMFFGNRRSR